MMKISQDQALTTTQSNSHHLKLERFQNVYNSLDLLLNVLMKQNQEVLQSPQQLDLGHIL